MNDSEPLTWEATYAIALALRAQHPTVNLEEVSLDMVYRWTLALPAFADDPALANQAILMDIYTAWLEESLHDPE